MLSNYHTHTEFCDGLNTMSEFAEAALSRGFRSLGFSPHGYVPFEGLYHGMPDGDLPAYLDMAETLKRFYAGKLDIYAGLENDEANMHDPGAFDYTIGSVHCIKRGDRYYSVDSWESVAAQVIAGEFGGDGIAYAKAYYDAVREFASRKRADILGHLDVVRRFNSVKGGGAGGAAGGIGGAGGGDAGGAAGGIGGAGGGDAGGEGGYRFFNERAPEYRRAAESALEAAVRSGYIIEVSTGPLSKGFSDEPYPAVFLLERAKEMGARVMINSDAHAAANLDYAFGAAERILLKAGFTERWELAPGGFEPVRL